MKRPLALVSAVVASLCGLPGALVSLCAQPLVITEIMTENRGALLDEDGDSSDWIELQNQSASAFDLEGWRLTDDPRDLSKWSFPAVELLPGRYLLVFASGKDRAVSGAELHTGFRLDVDGEFLALVAPDGLEVVHAYSPAYPPQRAGVSYGLSQRAASVELVRAGSDTRFLVPRDGSLGSAWTEAVFDDVGWDAVEVAVGFEAGEAPPPPVELVNIAPAGVATQSTTGYGGVPARAIDGNRSGRFGDGSITHTATGDPQPWWQLALDGRHVVRSLVLWNREDCCSRRLSNFRISLRDAEAEIVFSEDFFTAGAGFPDPSLEIPVGDVETATVRVELLGSNAEDELYLSLAEVEVLALVEGLPGGANVAFGKVARQSSTAFGGFASRAVDGNTDGVYSRNSISHTSPSDAAPFWEVDLASEYNLGSAVLWNRLDCCSHRLSDFRVAVLDDAGAVVTRSDHFTDGGFPGAQDYELVFPVGTRGRFVRVEKLGPDRDGENILSLAEVEVFDEDLAFHRLLRTDVEDRMLGLNASAYLRVPFEVDDPGRIDLLTLRMKYDDGFVAYLNGAEIARRNAPGVTRWNASATREQPDSSALVFEEIDISDRADLLLSGANVLAIHGLNIAADDDDFLVLPELTAFLFVDQRESFFLEPSPGSPNDSEGFDGFVADTSFAPDRGFHDEPIEVVISTPTEGADIVYTLDSTVPTGSHGTLYSGPIRIATTTVLRAAAFKPGLGPTNVDTHTYVFLDDVIDSSVMRTSITRDPRYAPQMRAALTDLPSISIVSPRPVNGNFEVPISLEMIHRDGESGFQENAGVRYYGGAFTSFAKKNFRIYFRSEYGDTKLSYPLFDGHDRGVRAVEVFDQIELRGGSHDMNQRGFYMSNRFTDDTMLDMGNLNPHGRFVHLYLNGTYWGQYHLRERWNADMLAQYLGGEKEDYEAINGNWNVGGWPDPGVPYDGDGSAWERIKSLRGDFEAVSPYLDVRHYVDFMLMFMFGNSEDEYRCVGPTGPGSGFKFLLNDADGFTRSAGNRTGRGRPGRQNGDGPGSIFSMLRRENHPDYRVLLADRIQELFFDDGVMTPAKNRARLLERCDEVERAFIAEAARWGYRTPSSWRGAKSSYLAGVLPSRTAAVIRQYRAAGFLLPTTAPRLARHGGAIEAGFRLTMSAPSGTVHYTLDGSDPRLPGGAISDTARVYSSPVVLEETVVVAARARTSSGSWSAVTDAVFHTDMPLRVTEIMYNPAPPADGSPFRRRELEYIELQNVGGESLDLNGVRLVGGIEFDFTASAVTELAPGEIVVLVEDIRGFASRYDLARVLVAGEYSGALSDGGERIAIHGRLDEPVLEFEYDDAWYPQTDGSGTSLVIVDPAADLATWSEATSWRPSDFELGSPGVEESEVAPRGRQLPADANQDSLVDISDGVALLRHLFGRSPAVLPCGDGTLSSEGNIALLDANGDDAVDVADVLWVLAYLFRSGDSPSLGTRCVSLPGCPNVCGS